MYLGVLFYILLLGLTFGIFGKYSTHFGRHYPVIFGCAVHIGAFLITFLNLPFNSPIEDTSIAAYINPSNPYLAVLGSFLLGLGDACLVTQVYSIIGSVFKADSAAGFAILQFTKSAFSATAFFYSKELKLPYQLLILAVLCVLSTITFSIVELRTRNLTSMSIKECEVSTKC